MANLSVLNRLMKVQKLLLTINGANGASSGGGLGIAGHTFATASAVNQQQRQRLHQKHTVTTVGQQKRTQRYTLAHAYSTAAGTTTSATDKEKSSAATTLEEFRAREQAELHREDEKEQEHQQNSSTEDDAKRAKADEVRTLILDAALEHIPEHGWTRQAIICGAEDAGYPSVVHGMFPEGGFALVAHFNGKCNKKLVQHLDEITEGGNKEITNPPEFLVNAVRMRLDMLTPYKAQWPQALALIALPQNASTALAQLLTLVDDICFYSGDRSVDIGWYTRRIGLGTIFKMTELYMLQDTSPQHSSTWEFLENRMEEAVQLQTVLMQTGDMTSRFQRSFNSAFITARNILGLGYQRD